MHNPADWVQEKKAKVEKARGPFETLCLHWMGVDQGDPWRGRSLPVYARLKKALLALREWRDVNNQERRLDDEVAMAVRVVADSMASEIAAAAGDDQDPATIAWIVAGLRCSRRPFCLGCDTCFTVDAPHRADVQFPTTAPHQRGES